MTVPAIDTPFSALERFNQAAAPVEVRLTLRSGAVIDGTAVGGDEHGLLLAGSATTEPRTIASSDITAVTIREPSHPRMMLLFIAAMVGGIMLLNAVLPLMKKIAPFASSPYVGGGIGFVLFAMFGKLTETPYVKRLLNPPRDIYNAPRPPAEHR